MSGRGAHRQMTMVMSALLIVLGVAILVRTISEGGGPLATGLLLGVLFIAAGAFHKVKPSDLVPELQGRLPLRVELDSLGEEDLFRILQEPESSLVGQYQALLGGEGLELRFDEEALREVASFAARMNAEMENIGARRLQTILELLLEEISFDAHARRGETVVVDASLVRRRLEGVISDGDLRKYLL